MKEKEVQYRQYIGLMKARTLQLDCFIDNVTSFEIDIDTIENIAAYEAIPIPDNLVFGKRSEYFFGHYLDQSSRYNIISANIQVYDNKVTLGEFDYILRDQKKNEIIHLELVTKFYLSEQTSSKALFDINDWVGPNKRDSLKFKIDKLREKQFPLLKTPQSKKVLNELGVNPDSVKQQLCYKACLFTTFTNKSSDHNYSDGYWIGHQDFLNLFKKLQYAYYLPSKRDWLIDPAFISNWLPYIQVENMVLEQINKANSPLIFVKTSSSSFFKLFVTWS